MATTKVATVQVYQPEPDECGPDPEAALTARLDALCSFVATFAPAIGQRADGEIGAGEVEDDASPDVLSARDAALVEAFRAIGRIAVMTAVAEKGDAP